MESNWTSSQASEIPHSGPSTSISSDAYLNPISCIVCRRRKVKCNRILPSCSNCSKGETRCIYPASARASRRKQVNLQYLGEAAADNEATLVKRLKHLEGMVAKLSSHVEKSPDSSLDVSIADPAVELVTADGTEGISRDLGKLVVEQGQRRYISSQVWDNLIDEVEDIKDVYASTPGTDDYDSPKHEDQVTNSFFGAGGVGDLHLLRPMVSQISYYWHVFAEAVDPLIKVIHQPTMDKMIKNLIINQMKETTPEMELFMFSVYFSVVTSMSPEDVFNSFGELKSVLSSRYRHGFEQALANADFLKTQDLLVVQSLIIFLMFAKVDDQRYVWTMTATVIRIAQFIGCHRDGTTFGLSPFETEMRRRVWWWVWGLDLRTAEDFSTEPIISRTGFDTRLPLNIEDSDISPESVVLPKAREEFTAMSNFLMRCELMGPTTVDIYSQPVYLPKELGGTNSDSRTEYSPKIPSFEEMEASVDNCNQFLESTWLPRCDIDNDPRAWLSVIMARIVIIKMRIFIYKPRPGAAMVRTQEIRDKLFTYTLEVIELENLGISEPRVKKWSWWFLTLRQWGAMAFVLAELCVRKGSPEVVRAWAALDERLEIWNMDGLERQGLGQRKHSLWFPIKKILEKASAVRLIDEYMRSQGKHTTKSMLAAENIMPSNDQAAAPAPWDLMDDFRLSALNPESTLFGPFDPMIMSEDWNFPPSADYLPVPDQNDPRLFTSHESWHNL